MFDFQRAFQPYEILVLSSPKFEIWGPPSWRTLGTLVTSVWRQCAQPKFVNSFKTSCFFVSELHKKPWQQKTQSEMKKQEMMSDLICLPNSGWAHWCHVLVTRLLTILQGGGSQISNFENFIGLESSLEAEILVSTLPLYNLFIGEKKKTYYSKKFESES